MTKLEELKERLNAIPKDYFDDCEGGEITGGVDFELLQLVSKDVPWLISEVERLRRVLGEYWPSNVSSSCAWCGEGNPCADECQAFTPDGEVK